VFLDDSQPEGSRLIPQLDRWYKDLGWKCLNRWIIDKYWAVNQYQKRQNAPSALQRDLDDAISLAPGTTTPSWRVVDFVHDLQMFLNSREGQSAFRSRKNGAKNIQEALQMPKFTFTQAEWERFYRIPEFGRIRLVYDFSNRREQLRTALKALLEDPLEEQTLRSVMHSDGNLHVQGVGENIVTKVLTVLDRKRWPVLNRRVSETVRSYGYAVRWGAAGYLDFARDMRELITYGFDFWAFDAFCEVKSRKLPKAE
jgi:hypothetical protein